MRNWFVTSNFNKFIIGNDLELLNITVNYCVRSRFTKNIVLHIEADIQQIRQVEKMSWCRSVVEV